MHVDCCLTCASVIPKIIWFIALALGLFKSPFHICDRLIDGLPHALSSALLLFHARPWKQLPQLRHSFSFSRLIPAQDTLNVPFFILSGTHSRTFLHFTLPRTHSMGLPDQQGACFLLIVCRLFTSRSLDCYLSSVVCFTSRLLDFLFIVINALLCRWCRHLLLLLQRVIDPIDVLLLHGKLPSSSRLCASIQSTPFFSSGVVPVTDSSCCPSDRFLSFMGELQAQAGIGTHPEFFFASYSIGMHPSLSPC